MRLEYHQNTYLLGCLLGELLAVVEAAAAQAAVVAIQEVFSCLHSAALSSFWSPRLTTLLSLALLARPLLLSLIFLTKRL